MKKVILISLVLIFSMLLMQCAEESTAEVVNEKIEKTIPVKTMRLQPQEFSSYLEITGTVKARNHINIVVEEGGILKRVLIDKGHYANKGDTLAILENKILEASFQQARATLKQAELDFNSKKVLYEKKAISENEFLSSKYAYDAALSAYKLAYARYQKLFITAPMRGLVNNRYYDIGAYATPMTPIFEFIDNEWLKVNAGVAERFIKDIKIGTPVEIRFDAFPDLKIQSKISFVSRSINPVNRTFEIEVEFPNPQQRLAPEMVANLKILRTRVENQIVIPVDALIETEEGWFVYVVENNRAKKVAVQQKAIFNHSVLVDGLNPGAQLVVVGHQELSDGVPVSIVRN